MILLDFMLVVKLTLCALGLLCMCILTGQTFLLCCYLFPRDPFSSWPSFPSASLSYCEETLLVVDNPNIDKRTQCNIYIYNEKNKIFLTDII